MSAPLASHRCCQVWPGGGPRPTAPGFHTGRHHEGQNRHVSLDEAVEDCAHAHVGRDIGRLGLTAVLVELSPTRLRCSRLAWTYGLASALFGGTAPVVAAALTR